MHEIEEKQAQTAAAAKARLEKSLGTAKSMIRDYRRKLGPRRNDSASEGPPIFRFDR